MISLLIKHDASKGKSDCVHLKLISDGSVLGECSSAEISRMSGRDAEDLRWYLEDYVIHQEDPAPQIAARIEQRISQMGTRLFTALFACSMDAQNVWTTAKAVVDDIHVRIETSATDDMIVPWELIRDPGMDKPFAATVRSFVRCGSVRSSRDPSRDISDGIIRVLLVICRPGGTDDVPFRSVARHLLHKLVEERRSDFCVDVLRPPTFESLKQVLGNAKADGHPYQIVHCDGHGVYEDMPMGQSIHSPRGPRGYVVFEDPENPHNQDFVDGCRLGKALAGADVPVLVLNACRSAHAHATVHMEKPLSVGRMHSFESLSHEVMAAGVQGVVAMRYNVYVATAVRFMTEFYAGLADGLSLGEAATTARRTLADDPVREIGYSRLAVQDWMVPVVYETDSAAVFMREESRHADGGTHRESGSELRGITVDPRLIDRPDIGCVGMDDAFLTIDRAFDDHRVILLHGYAGSGKSVAATEFARWYALTGGLDNGYVLFTSFKEHKTLATILNEAIEPVFDKVLNVEEKDWLALSEEERREETLRVCCETHILWIWDNVESVTGLLEGTETAWPSAERHALAELLRDICRTRAKVLLTSRSEELDWLGELPVRIDMAPMPAQDRVRFAQSLATYRGKFIADMTAWEPLLEFTQGNPLSMRLVIGQALREQIVTRDGIDAFVARLSEGAQECHQNGQDEQLSSLRASLDRTIRCCFTPMEAAILSILSLCQDAISSHAVLAMAGSQFRWHLPQLSQFGKDKLLDLLARAVEIGLLSTRDHVVFLIHPLVRALLHRTFRTQCELPRQDVLAAYAGAYSGVAGVYHMQYTYGQSGAIEALAIEEGNILCALRIAMEYGYLKSIVNLMQGLDALYESTGRVAEWKALVAKVAPLFGAATTGAPLSGYEREWNLVNIYNVRLSLREENYERAGHIQRGIVSWAREALSRVQSRGLGESDEEFSEAVHDLGVALEHLALILRERKDPACIGILDEAQRLFAQIGARTEEAVIISHLGDAYVDMPGGTDCDAAESCYLRSLALLGDAEPIRRARCFRKLGYVARARFVKAKVDGVPEKLLAEILNQAGQLYCTALELLAPEALVVSA